MAAEGTYPLSTQDGKHIPLDVVRPKSLVRYDFAINTAADVTIPAGYALCWAYATQDCFLRLSATNLPNGLVAGTPYPDTIFIPGSTPIVFMAVPGEASLLGGATAGYLLLNWVEQWAALIQAKQSSVG